LGVFRKATLEQNPTTYSKSSEASCDSYHCG